MADRAIEQIVREDWPWKIGHEAVPLMRDSVAEMIVIPSVAIRMEDEPELAR